MPIATSQPSRPRELVPEGTHIARVYQIVHIGAIPTEWKGEPRITDKVRIGFELPNETRVFKEGEEPRPMVINDEYTLSMGEKSRLRPVVEGIIGTRLREDEAAYFEVNDLMGQACMVNVVHNKKGDKTYENIASTVPLPKGIEGAPAVNEPFLLDYEANWSEERYAKLPEFIRTKMATSQQYKQKHGGLPMAEEFDKTPDPDKTYKSGLEDSLPGGYPTDGMSQEDIDAIPF